MGVLDIVLAAAENPYRNQAAFERAGRLLLDPGASAELLHALSGAERTVQVRAVLGLGHLEARAHPRAPDRVLSATRVPARLWKGLGIARSSVLRVAMAAGRAGAELDRFAGESLAVGRVRAEVWSACFGRSLEHALALESVIRDHDVLILGETGTGKELIARAIQVAVLGPPDGGAAPSAALNVAAVPDPLVESELFGHVKGAFTGAHGTRLGRIRSAHTGSLFLDEIGDLPLSAQVKLLRVMETDVVNPLGSDTGHRADVRYVAATHGNLEELVELGRFRQDLYQRLGGSVVRLPPLRERPEDLIHIGHGFIAEYVTDTQALELDEVERWLASPEATGYAWPGNVRELQNVLRDLLLGLDPRPTRFARERRQTERVPEDVLAGRASLERAEAWYFDHVMAHHSGSYAEASRVLGIDRSTLYRRLKRRGPGPSKRAGLPSDKAAR